MEVGKERGKYCAGMAPVKIENANCCWPVWVRAGWESARLVGSGWGAIPEVTLTGDELWGSLTIGYRSRRLYYPEEFCALSLCFGERHVQATGGAMSQISLTPKLCFYGDSMNRKRQSLERERQRGNRSWRVQPEEVIYEAFRAVGRVLMLNLIVPDFHSSNIRPPTSAGKRSSQTRR